MKYLLINSVCSFGSTGNACIRQAKDLEAEGHEVKIAYGRIGKVPEEHRFRAVRIGNDLDTRLHGIWTRLTDGHGFASKSATRRFLRWAEEYKPDVVWLHNLHGYFINIEMLFDWLKKHPEIQVKWTHHDCWAFTGHCAYFTMVNCNQWETHCTKCVKQREYPASLLVDRCSRNFDRKKAAFTGLKNMYMYAPSEWLADLLKRSFLGEYPVEVVYNVTDTDVFKPTPSDFRKKHGLEDKIIVLGVANIWDKRKGLDDFVQLAAKLDERFKIVLVGLNDKQLQELPANILGLHRTANREELAQIYSASDIFVNPSREEAFGRTTAEAALCGSKVIAYACTASEEVVRLYGGVCIPPDNDLLYDTIMQVANEK